MLCSPAVGRGRAIDGEDEMTQPHNGGYPRARAGVGAALGWACLIMMMVAPGCRGTGPVQTAPAMPPVTDPANLYSDASADRFSPAVSGALPRVYVPKSALERRFGDRPGDVRGRRPFQGGHEPPARGALVGPEVAMGH